METTPGETVLFSGHVLWSNNMADEPRRENDVLFSWNEKDNEYCSFVGVINAEFDITLTLFLLVKKNLD